MKTEVKGRQDIEKPYDGEEARGIELSEKVFYQKPANKEEQKKSIKDFFNKLVGREMTNEELEDYLFLFEKGKTNLFLYTRKFQPEDINSEVIKSANIEKENYIKNK